MVMGHRFSANGIPAYFLDSNYSNFLVSTILRSKPSNIKFRSKMLDILLKKLTEGAAILNTFLYLEPVGWGKRETF